MGVECKGNRRNNDAQKRQCARSQELQSEQLTIHLGLGGGLVASFPRPADRETGERDVPHPAEPIRAAMLLQVQLAVHGASDFNLRK